jgi:hypothetical protein
MHTKNLLRRMTVELLTYRLARHVIRHRRQ